MPKKIYAPKPKNSVQEIFEPKLRNFWRQTLSKILVTGGAGYIGSHTVLELLDAGLEVVIADNFINSSPESIVRLEKISGQKIPLVEINLCDKSAVDKLFSDFTFDSVVHFAA